MSKYAENNQKWVLSVRKQREKETKVHSQYQEAVEKQPEADSQISKSIGPRRLREAWGGPQWPGERGRGEQRNPRIARKSGNEQKTKKRKKKRRGTDAPSADEGPAPSQGGSSEIIYFVFSIFSKKKKPLEKKQKWSKICGKQPKVELKSGSPRFKKHSKKKAQVHRNNPHHNNQQTPHNQPTNTSQPTNQPTPTNTPQPTNQPTNQHQHQHQHQHHHQHQH